MPLNLYPASILQPTNMPGYVLGSKSGLSMLGRLVKHQATKRQLQTCEGVTVACGFICVLSGFEILDIIRIIWMDCRIC